MPGIQTVVYSGDVTHNGKAKEYAVLARLLRQYGGRLPAQYLIPGNHDVALNEKDWAEQIGYFLEYTGMPGTFYRFAIGGKTALCLGSGAEGPAGDMDSVSFSAQQLEWLAAQLADAAQSDPESPIFVFLHQPLQNTLTGTEASAILENDALRAILDQYPQAVVFSGHSHAALNSEKPVYDGNGFGASMVHSGSVSALSGFQPVRDRQSQVRQPGDSGGGLRLLHPHPQPEFPNRQMDGRRRESSLVRPLTKSRTARSGSAVSRMVSRQAARIIAPQ